MSGRKKIMIKKHYYSWQDVEKMCVQIATQMYKDNWRPDYIVGITRGGNIPATILSNMLDIRCEALKVALRDGESHQESNLWMAEDAYNDKKILIVDDINDTGATFNWIMQDWPAGCYPDDSKWNHVFGNNVRVATLTDNMASEVLIPINYTCHEINKAEEDVWLVYPWENVNAYA
jgi:hypoxanthine phosphoribosyltransferase